MNIDYNANCEHFYGLVPLFYYLLFVVFFVASLLFREFYKDNVIYDMYNQLDYQPTSDKDD